MDNKTLIAVGASAIVTLLVTTIIGSLFGVFARGSEALTEDQIRAVLEEVMVTDNGDTYGQVLVSVNNRLLVVETKLTSMQRALEALSAP